MTDRYIRPSLGSGGTGTDEDPYGTVAAAYTAASAGDTLFIDTTTGDYAPTAQVQDTKGVIVRPWIGTRIVVDASNLASSYVWRLEAAGSDVQHMKISGAASGKYAFRINANIAGFSDNIVKDGAATAVLVSSGHSGTSTWHRNQFIRMGAGWRIDGATGTINMYCEYHRDLVSYNRIQTSAPTVNAVNCLYAAGDFESWLVSTGTLNLHNCQLLGGGQDVPRECINVALGATVNAYSCIGTRGVLDSGSFLKDCIAGAGTINVDANSEITGGIGTLFSASRRPEACLAFVRDDLEDYVTGGASAGEWDSWLDELEARGYRGTYAMSTREGDVSGDIGSTSAAGWSDVKSIVARGHEIATHGCTGYHLNMTEWLTVQYTGSATAARLVIADGYLRTYEDGVLDLEIEITARPKKVETLATQINADANYTAAYVTDGDSDASVAHAGSLADVDLADIKTASVTLSCDLDRAFSDELAQCKSDIVNNAGFTPVAHVYSTGGYNSGLATRMASNGWRGGRLGAVAVDPYNSAVYKFPGDESGYDPFQMCGIQIANFIDLTSETTIKAGVEAICQWAMWHGACVSLYAHAFSELSQAQWGHVLDAVQASGIPVKTLGEMLRTNVSQASSNTASDDAWAPNLASDSAWIGAGGRTWSGPNPVGLDGEPIADWSSSIGPVQSQAVPFHPTKL